MLTKYVNPFTDFGFKKLFGEAGSKDLLADFLNQLLPKERQIVTLEFKNSEQLGGTNVDRKAIYDIYCQDQHGSRFIVELQKARQHYFKERTIFYSTFPIREQAEMGEWDYHLTAVYCIGILDFVFESESDNPDYLHLVQLKTQRHKVFYDKLAYCYIEMPKFKKTAAELETHLDKWLYFIKNLEDFQSIPRVLQEDLFRRGFMRAEIANYNRKERSEYERSLKVYRDLKNVLDTAFDEGEEKGEVQGRQKEKVERIKKSLALGKLSVAEIAEIFEVSEDFVRQHQQKPKRRTRS
ncbi:MAG: PD-(D/E)XK nuclease family transposase [Acidobacteria bacterium]|nr:PD-(D/E)XK nuclease family transposase [Acidobacteriota bacterium]